MKIFIAESSRRIYVRLIRLLKSLENVKVEGENARPSDAIHNIIKSNSDVIILDGGFAGGKSWETLKAIRKQNSRTVVFILSDFPDEQYKRKCMEAGADFFFDKSNEIDRLLDALRTLSNKLN